MNLQEELFDRTVQQLSQSSGGSVGLASAEFASWLASSQKFPPHLVSFLTTHSPKTELWAGAGSIFDETTIMHQNLERPRLLQASLFIIGCAPNGDFIALDLENSSGAIGYVMHEQVDSVQSVRSVFVPICGSIGEFISRINADEHDLPNDYSEAVARRQ